MSKLKNEIEYGLDNFVKESSDEDLKKVWDWETKWQYLHIVEILEKENIKSYIEDLHLEHILIYIGQNDLEIPIEHDIGRLKTELMSSEFSVFYSKELWFTIDLSKEISWQEAHVIEDIYTMFSNIILLTSDAFNPNW